MSRRSDEYELLSAESILVNHGDDRCHQASGYDCAGRIDREFCPEVLGMPAIVSFVLSYHIVRRTRKMCSSAGLGRGRICHGRVCRDEIEACRVNTLSVRGQAYSLDMLTYLLCDTKLLNGQAQVDKTRPLQTVLPEGLKRYGRIRKSIGYDPDMHMPDPYQSRLTFRCSDVSPPSEVALVPIHISIKVLQLTVTELAYLHTPREPLPVSAGQVGWKKLSTDSLVYV